LRGKSWSVEEERQLRQLVEAGKYVDEISKIMGKSRLSIKGKLFNSGLNCLLVATGGREKVATTIATTTTPQTPAIDSASAPVPGSVSAPTAVSDGSAFVGGVSLKLPQRLPSVEEELKVLSAAVKAMEEPNLARVDVMRLRNIIQGVKIYQELYAKYVDYRGLEVEVLELRKQLATENAKGTMEES
jgi:hypothetical protein